MKQTLFLVALIVLLCSFTPPSKPAILNLGDKVFKVFVKGLGKKEMSITFEMGDTEITKSYKRIYGEEGIYVYSHSTEVITLEKKSLFYEVSLDYGNSKEEGYLTFNKGGNR